MSFIDNELFCSVGFLIFLSLHSLHSFLLGRLSVFLHIRGDSQLLIRLHSQLSLKPCVYVFELEFVVSASYGYRGRTHHQIKWVSSWSSEHGTPTSSRVHTSLGYYSAYNPQEVPLELLWLFVA